MHAVQDERRTFFRRDKCLLNGRSIHNKICDYGICMARTFFIFFLLFDICRDIKFDQGIIICENEIYIFSWAIVRDIDRRSLRLKVKEGGEK